MMSLKGTMKTNICDCDFDKNDGTHDTVVDTGPFDRHLTLVSNTSLVSVLLVSNDDTVDYDFTDNSRPSLICLLSFDE